MAQPLTGSARRDLVQRHAIELTIGAALLVALAALWLFTLRRVDQANQAASSLTVASLQERSQLLSLRWSTRLAQIGLLHDLARHGDLSGDAAPPAELRRTLAQPGFAIFQVAVLDAAGTLLWSTRPADRSMRVHDDLIRHQGQDSTIGDPVREDAVTGETSARLVIPFAQAIRADDGSLIGLSVVSLDADALAADALSLQAPPGEAARSPIVVELVRGDGVTLARSDDRRPSSLPSPQRQWLIAHARATGQSDRLIQGQQDGVTRFYAAHLVAGADLVLLVSTDQDSAFTPLRAIVAQRIQAAIALSLALTLCAFAATLAARRSGALRRARVQAQLHARQEAQWRRIAEQVTDLVSVSDAAMKTLYINPICQALLGVDPRRLIGRPFTALLHPDDRPAVETVLTALAAGGPQRFRCRRRQAGGGHRWLEYEMVAVDGEPDGRLYIAIGRDVTLEHEARARLQLSERLATLGAVTTSIAHEINRPLAVISLAAENALHALASGDTPAVAEKLRRIIEHANRLAKVMTHVRGFGRASPAKREPLDLASLLEGVLALADLRLAAAGVKVTTRLEAALPRPIGLRIALEQALLNLIMNACEAYEARPAACPREVLIDARRADGAILLRVADQAGGIDEALIGRIFDPFFTTKPAGTGTGIGLSISVAYLAEMGGSLSVHNESGGAVFDIRLPAVETVSPPVARTSPAPATTDQI